MGGLAPVWSRGTPWRQGHILPAAAAQQLGLSHPSDPENTCVMVISHDCDLATENLAVEPEVEVILGRLRETVNGSFTWAKSPRTLHLDILRGGTSATVELVSTGKKTIPKSVLAGHTPDPAFSLNGNGLSVLRSWLALRYNRASFPDAFVNALKDAKTDEKLQKLVGQAGNYVSAVFFGVDGGIDLDHSDGSPYALKVVLAYPDGDDPELSADIVETLADSISDLFSERHLDQKSGRWRGVELKGCSAISEHDFPVSWTRTLSQWRLEHMTLRSAETQMGPPSPDT